MNILKLSTLSLLYTLSLQSTTIYYNGEGDDIGQWFIQNESGTPNTTYRIRIQTLANGVVAGTSEAISFTTLAE